MAETFRLARSTLIAASPATVHTLVNDFHLWADWSPWDKIDADLIRTFEGPAAGPGSVYGWVGKKTGTGRMEILTSESDRIVIKLDFLKPFEAHNTAEFTFEPEGAQTRVTWAMTGPVTLMSKIMGLFFSMEKMVGPQFEQGLVNLKRIAEA
jgi:hypothetical protein